MYSIVIPTYNHCDDFLKPCLESIIKYTTDFECIVVANGCKDNTATYMMDLCNKDLRFKMIWSTDGLGYTKATNLGIKAATGDYVILLNNDTVLLDQPVNQWIEMLREPFKDSSVGVTGPVKFSWQCAGIQREAMAFWLVMVKADLFKKIGILDEVFSPGMGEDGDFCIRAVEAGYKLISVPNDVTGEFEVGIKNFAFPIWHAGNGTFADNHTEKNEIIERNNKILDDMYGIGKYFVPKGYKTNPGAVFDDLDNTDEFQREVYEAARALAFKHGYTRILDIGCGSGYKLMKYFAGFNTVGIDLPGIIEKVRERYPNNQWVEYVFDIRDQIPANMSREFDLVICSDVIEHVEYPDEMLWFMQLDIKFKHLVISTPDRGIIEQRGGSRFGPPDNFCHIREWNKHEFHRYLQNSGFKIEDHYISNEAQATQLAICTYTLPEISIVMPTYNHFDDAFKPGIDALLKYTWLGNKEVIVVANGCKPNDMTRTYLEKLGDRVRYIWIDEPAGYIGAVNAGIDASLGKYIVLIDNDSHLLPQQTDQWIHILQKPFLDFKDVGATSPFANEYEDMGFVLHSGCTMYDAQLLRAIGKFDPIYMPGYFSDSDVAMQIWRAGYRCVEVPVDRANKDYKSGMFAINFPVVHTGQIQTMDKNADIEILKKNRAILYSRYGKQTMPTFNKEESLGAQPPEKIEKYLIDIGDHKEARFFIAPKYSIVIPTYNHCDDLLRPCIESIIKYTNMDEIEVIIVANGCTDGTQAYLAELEAQYPKKIFSVWIEEAVGYTKATNNGIQLALGEFVLLLNNDTQLLEQPRNKWLDMIVEPFKDPQVGLSGPLMLHDDYADFDVIIFFCAMIRKSVIDQVGLLDEIFSPGGGEDIDYAVRVAQACYKIVPTTSTTFGGNTNVGGVPIWHKDNQTFKNIPEYTNHIVKRNGLINCKRYNKNIKLNLGSGGVPYKGYLSVDKYDKRAHVDMDITKLDFDDNSVTEILASHVFEHLNPYHSIAILQDWLRVLKPGGRLIMEMPDIEALCKRFVTASTGERYGILNAIYGSVNTTGVGGPDNITSPHLFGWWRQSLHDHLHNAGFTEIVFMEEKIPHPESNLRVEAVKPGGAPVYKINREALKAQEPATYLEIFEVDSYRLVESEIRDKVVVDIGANLGMFSLRCVELGAKLIYAIEAQPVVYNLGLLHNVKGYPMIFPMLAAVWDRDGEEMVILNEHVGSKVRSDGEGDKVTTVTLKKLIENVPDTDMVLKMDCEGSEFNILMGSDRETIRKFAFVHIEIHADTNENPAYKDVAVVRNRLTELGFERVSTMPVLWYGPNGETKELGVYVEKWVRV